LFNIHSFLPQICKYLQNTSRDVDKRQLTCYNKENLLGDLLMKVKLRPTLTLKKDEHEKLLRAAKADYRTVSNFILHIVRVFLREL